MPGACDKKEERLSDIAVSPRFSHEAVKSVDDIARGEIHYNTA